MSSADMASPYTDFIARLHTALFLGEKIDETKRCDILGRLIYFTFESLRCRISSSIVYSQNRSIIIVCNLSLRIPSTPRIAIFLAVFLLRAMFLPISGSHEYQFKDAFC